MLGLEHPLFEAADIVVNEDGHFSTSEHFARIELLGHDMDRTSVDHIASLEPVGRGASMGALGVIRANGDFDLALTIRTFAIVDERIHLWVGGGVVWDSDPQAEIAESWVKADPLLRAIGAPRGDNAERPAAARSSAVGAR